MRTDSELRGLVAADYLALADLLDGLGERWDAPTLCEGWRVREVVAHMTMPARYDEAAFLEELGRDGFDFTALSNRIAARDASLAASELVAALRDPSLHEWVPPDGGRAAALSHVVIHELDITIPLQVPRRSDDDSVAAVLELLTEGGAHRHFGTEVTGRRYVATDLDWSFGSGEECRAPAGHLIALLSGRRVVADQG